MVPSWSSTHLWPFLHQSVTRPRNNYEIQGVVPLVCGYTNVLREFEWMYNLAELNVSLRILITTMKFVIPSFNQLWESSICLQHGRVTTPAKTSVSPSSSPLGAFPWRGARRDDCFRRLGINRSGEELLLVGVDPVRFYFSLPVFAWRKACPSPEWFAIRFLMTMIAGTTRSRKSKPNI